MSRRDRRLDAVQWIHRRASCAHSPTLLLSRRYVTDLRINTVEVSFSVGWTWTGLIIFLAALIASFVTCCVGELVNEHHDHQY